MQESSQRVFTVYCPHARFCINCFMHFISALLTTWGLELKNLLLFKNISHYTSKSIVTTFGQYQSGIFTFIVQIIQCSSVIYNSIIRRYKQNCHFIQDELVQRHQSMYECSNKLVQSLLSMCFLEQKVTEICWCKRKKSYFQLQMGEKKGKDNSLRYFLLIQPPHKVEIDFECVWMHFLSLDVSQVKEKTSHDFKERTCALENPEQDHSIFLLNWRDGLLEKN